MLAIGLSTWIFTLEPIAQDASYHFFADQRIWLGVPNAWNVISNLPFVFIGCLGLRHRVNTGSFVFSMAVVLVGLGSSYYHWDPTTDRLVWDRLPMTIAFMALFAMILTDRLQVKIFFFWLLVIAGLASVTYWWWTEQLGRGDLRPYVVVQYVPLVLMPFLLMMKGNLKTRWLWGSFLGYALAKYAEWYDLAIFELVGVSGHTLKHLVSAMAVAFVARTFKESRRAIG